ncbi:MAG: LemA family protein [Tissierellia bacterium]|nr:LemA family protein [Tissierellia bacterium]
MRKKQGGGIIVIIAIIAVIAIFFGSQYNKLVTMEADVDNSWAQVQNQVKRRADLIPNLANTVKGYADHESETFVDLAQARSGVDNAQSPQELAEANDQLTNAVSRLNLVVEAYPELKANTNFLDLQAQLEGTENRIATERQRYNEQVTKFNKKVKRFPTNIIAGILGFHGKEYFEVSAQDQEVPEVKF